MNRIILILFFIGTFNCSAQEEAKLLLQGKWELVVEEKHLSENEAEIFYSGSVTKTESDDEKPKTYFVFKPSDSLHIIQNRTIHRTTYKVRDSVLFIGNNSFKIFQVSDTEVILQENGFTDKRYIYHRRE
ncbi:hypothetical protein LB467_18320 [Salegentibacter sp. JZCK2]|uniref:hypothetical protein n=1 Tax=Salegentibacter tibetensis TaxID=2873600 RepID=UPI001CC98EB6|nr:hypothetical protein [Salegentibacter tibetensis]MBZ9731646.1 hypothetical protein [Salegentibacter tibetensis]